MLQFQSRGTLAATSGVLASPRPAAVAGGVATGVGGAAFCASDEAELDDWLLLRLCQVRYWSKQWAQVREGGARGLKLASWSKGTPMLECWSQNMLPQRRQWWRRTK